MFARVEPDSFFLLLAALLYGMDALSEDRSVLLECDQYGHCGELRLTTCSYRMTRILRRSTDLKALSPAAPHRRDAWTLAEYLIGCSGFDIQITGDAASGTLMLQLILPVSRQSFDFKSPADEEKVLRRAASVVTQALHLLDSEQKQ